MGAGENAVSIFFAQETIEFEQFFDKSFLSKCLGQHNIVLSGKHYVWENKFPLSVASHTFQHSANLMITCSGPSGLLWSEEQQIKTL